MKKVRIVGSSTDTFNSAGSKGRFEISINKDKYPPKEQ